MANSFKRIDDAPWLGNVPYSWDYIKISHVGKLGRGRVISNLELIPNGGYPVYSSQTKKQGEMGRIDTYDFHGEYVTWTTDGANAGTVFARSGKFNCTNVCGTIKPSNKIFYRFLAYVLSIETKRYVRLDINPKLMNNEMAQIRVLVPPKNEQKKIANFLDQKTSEIDSLIADKEKLIELLEEKRQAIITEAVTKGLNPDVEMKDSGVEWIGEIPEHWDIKKVKHVSTLVGSGKTPRGGGEVYSKKGITFIRSMNVHFEGLKLDDVVYIDESIDQDMKTTRVFPKDVLLNITGASIGRTCMVPKEFSKGNVNQHVCIIRPSINVVPFMLSKIMVSQIIQNQIYMSQTGSSREGLNFNQIKKLLFPLPNTIEEQNSISNYIDRKSKQLTQVIKDVNKQIGKLKDYRQSLIYETVTGKIDVREYEKSPS